MANTVWGFLQNIFHRPAPGASPAAPVDEAEALAAFSAALKLRIARYLAPRLDRGEQENHLRHVATRARWLYAQEQQRPAAQAARAPRGPELIETCVFCHDMGKWVPREELRALFSEDRDDLARIFHELGFSPDQTELFLLGIRRRLNLARDGYIPEYDAAHHLVSAFILVTDPELGFHRLAATDQAQLLRMVIGHQFGSYFKGSLLNLSLHDPAVTTGMLVDTARADRLAGDLLSSVFHDADISDLLYVGSIEQRADGTEVFHSGGLVKILMINYANLLYAAPQAPTTQAEIQQSCRATVDHACKEFLTQTAVERGSFWRAEARGFMDALQAPALQQELQAVLDEAAAPVPERLDRIRTRLYATALHYLKTSAGR